MFPIAMQVAHYYPSSIAKQTSNHGPNQVKSYTLFRLVILISNPPSCLGNQLLIIFQFFFGSTSFISYDVTNVARTLHT